VESWSFPINTNKKGGRLTPTFLIHSLQKSK